MHAGGAVHRVINKLIGILIQLSPVALGQELGKAGYHAQGFLEVMGGHIGKLLQLCIGALQIFCVIGQQLFGPATLIQFHG